jgi:hypothetical protein
MAATADQEGRGESGETGTPAGEQTAGEDRPRPGRRLRVHHGELTSATSALLLLAVMFLTKWYGVAGVPDPSAARPAISTAVNGFNGLTSVRWVMLLTICAALGSVLLHASQRSHGTRTDTSRVLVVLGSLTAILLIYRVLIAFPAPHRMIDQKLGAYLGLLCAFGVALGGRQSMLEQEDRTRAAATRRRRRVRVASRHAER